MLSLPARLLFYALVLTTAAFFIFGFERIKIDTNLNDLNPNRATDAGLQYATDTLLEDVSKRFVVLIKGPSASNVSSALTSLQVSLDAHSHLEVLSTEKMQEQYLAVLSPYRFSLLSEAQRQTLIESDVELMAVEAQRKLYQLTDGIRLIPFEEDPLGWFSEYLITRFERFNIDAQSTGEVIRSAEEGMEPSVFYETFSVYIAEPPSSMAEQKNLYEFIKNLEAEIRDKFSVEVLHSGMFFFAVDSAESAKGDIQLIAIGSTLGVLVLMILVFRSLLPLCLALGSIALGVSFGVLVSTTIFGSIHVLTIVFGASLIGIVVDYSLHYFYHCLSQHDANEHPAKGRTALKRAMQLSVFTSLLGYAALSLSDLTMLNKVAVFSCSGLFMAWLGVMVLGPVVSKRPIIARQTLLVKVLSGLRAVFGKHPKVLSGVTMLLSAVCVGSLYFVDLRVNDDPRLFFQVSPTLLKQEQDIAKLTQVYEPGRYIVVKGRSEQDVYNSLTSLYLALGENSKHISSILDWVPSQQTQKQDYALQEALYKQDGVLDTFYQRLGISNAQSMTAKQAYAKANGRTMAFADFSEGGSSTPPLLIKHDEHVYSFVLILKNSDMESIERISASIPDTQFINTLGDAIESLKAQRTVGAELLLLSYVLVGVLIVLYYKKLSAIRLLLIPIVSSIFAIAIIAMLGQAITIFHVMALFLVLGLGMDYIIFANEMKQHQNITQQAILLSAITSLLSFGLLAFSSMPITQAFGSTILIGNSINFIAAISLFNTPRQTAEKYDVEQ